MTRHILCFAVFLAILAPLASASLRTSAQEAPPRPDAVMSTCHAGLSEIEKALRSVEDADLRADINVFIEEIYRAQDRDEGGWCLTLISRAREALRDQP